MTTPSLTTPAPPMHTLRHLPRVPAVILSLSCVAAVAAPPRDPDAVRLRADDTGIRIEFRAPEHGTLRVDHVQPAWSEHRRPPRLIQIQTLPHSLRATFAVRHLRATIEAQARAGEARLRLVSAVGPTPRIVGRVPDEDLLAARIALKDGRPYVFGRGDVLEIGTGRVSSRNANCLYSVASFFGLAFETAAGASPEIVPDEGGHAFRAAGDRLTIRCVDVWPVLGWRPEGGWPGESRAGLPPGHIVPREWMRGHRPFPWQTFSPVQLPFISITDPNSFPQVREQIDFLADNLRDYGFFCFGEWPLTQYYPEYDPTLQPAWLEGNRRTCDYAHSKGIKVLRWLTDPDIDAGKYPDLHRMMLQNGWFSHREGDPEWLLDYTNPDVQAWITDQYARLAATGPDFYWIDNNQPTQPIHDRSLPPPVAFRNFFLSIQRGLLSTGRNDILMRSGASAWADYSGVGILDVYAPGPDVQDDWLEQQIYVAEKLAYDDYLDHFNLWRRCIDDYFPAGPQTVDQTRAMATLLALTGLGFTTTDVGFPNIPADRLEMLRQVVPITTTRPLDLFRFEHTGLPHWWVLHAQRGDQTWAVAGVFNWGLRAEEVLYASFDELGLDPDREYLVYDFYSQAPVGIFANGIGCRVAPSSGRALAIHALRDRPLFVSTDRHITQGAAETEGLRWDRRSARLSGVFTRGVKGRTYHVTIYVPPGHEVRAFRAGGREGRWERQEAHLVRGAIPCDSERIPWSFTFDTHRAAPPTQGTPAPHIRDAPNVVVVRSPSERRDWRKLASEQGKTIVLLSPSGPSAALRAFQDSTGVAWGLYRKAGSNAVWLTVGGATPELPDGTLFQTSCIGFRVNAVLGVYKPLGRGGILVLSPSIGPARLAEIMRAVRRNKESWAAGLVRDQERLLHATLSTVSPVVLDLPDRQASQQVTLSPSLRGRELSFHIRRHWPSLGTSFAGVPRIALRLNGTDLPNLLNPCRPYSPPEGYDLCYYQIPAGLPRFGSPANDLVMTARQDLADPAAFEGDAATALELRIETPSRIGDTELVPLPEIALLWDPLPLDAFLGAGGDAVGVTTRQADGFGIRLAGDVHGFYGWPVRGEGVTHCAWALDAFTVELTVPPGTAGVVEALAYDADSYRRETVAFEGRDDRRLDDFANGVWLKFPFTADDSADGLLRIQVTKLHGYNCVLSRLRLRQKNRDGAYFSEDRSPGLSDATE